MGVPCFFSLSWFITWFSHDVHNLPDVARLFDLFLSSHPMMPLYVGAAGIAASRDELIQLTEMCELHSALVNLRVGNYISTDDLILQVSFNVLTMECRISEIRTVRSVDAVEASQQNKTVVHKC